jgi:hypothetical protein
MVAGKRTARRSLRAARALVEETTLDRPIVLSALRVAA